MKNSAVSPHFELPLRLIIKQFQSVDLFHLQQVDSSAEVSGDDLKQITTICNESLVYGTLFKERLKDRTYVHENAVRFIEWAKDGWDKNDKFVFLIRSVENKIVGAIDIKSDNLDSAEIGYWMTSNVPGVMTNAVLAICDLAKIAGYKELYGLTVPENLKSQRVLLRAGFLNEGVAEEEGKEYIKFTKTLSTF
jgi:RimJ/RimL family protein N-acetyltransferase